MAVRRGNPGEVGGSDGISSSRTKQLQQPLQCNQSYINLGKPSFPPPVAARNTLTAAATAAPSLLPAAGARAATTPKPAANVLGSSDSDCEFERRYGGDSDEEFTPYSQCTVRATATTSIASRARSLISLRAALNVAIVGDRAATKPTWVVGGGSKIITCT